MPDLTPPSESEVLNTPSNNQTPPNRPLIDETVTAHLLQIFGNQSQQYVPTQAQVDKIIGLQEKGMDYTHQERTCFSPKQKIETGVFVLVVFLMVGMFVFSVYKAPQYTGEILAGIIGFFGGGLSGYGYANSKKRDGNNKEE